MGQIKPAHAAPPHRTFGEFFAAGRGTGAGGPARVRALERAFRRPHGTRLRRRRARLRSLCGSGFLGKFRGGIEVCRRKEIGMPLAARVCNPERRSSEPVEHAAVRWLLPWKLRGAKGHTYNPCTFPGPARGRKSRTVFYASKVQGLGISGAALGPGRGSSPRARVLGFGSAAAVPAVRRRRGRGG